MAYTTKTYTESEFNISSAGFNPSDITSGKIDVRIVDTITERDEQFKNTALYRVTRRGYITDSQLKAQTPIKLISSIDTGRWSVGYEYNSPLNPNIPTANTHEGACYRDFHIELKLDDDERARWSSEGKENMWIKDTKREAFVELKQHYNDFFNEVIQKAVTKENKGLKAGKYGNITLGTPDKPVAIDDKNIYSYLMKFVILLHQQQRFSTGNMFMILPVTLMEALAQSPNISLPNTQMAVDVVTKLQLPPKLLGCDVYFDAMGEPSQVGNQIVSPVIVGRTNQIGINDKIVTEELIRSTLGYFDELRIRSRIGLSIIDNKSIAIGYVSQQ